MLSYYLILNFFENSRKCFRILNYLIQVYFILILIQEQKNMKIHRLTILLIFIHSVLSFKLNPTLSQTISTFKELKQFIMKKNIEQSKIQKIHITQIIKPSLFSNGLYLSNYAAAMDLNTIKEKKIGAILTVGRQLSSPIFSGVKTQKINLQDNLSEDLSQILQKSYKFISKNLEKTNVLVHCKQGISRSATIVIAYLMQSNNLSLSQAFSLVKQKRALINPNDNFMKQLKTLEKDLVVQNELKLKRDRLKSIGKNLRTGFQLHHKTFNIHHIKFMRDLQARFKMIALRSVQNASEVKTDDRYVTQSAQSTSDRVLE